MKWIKISSVMIAAMFWLAGATGAQASPSEPETYAKLNLSVGGYYYIGNVNQVQANLQGHYGLSSPTTGVDVLFSGFRLWSKPDEDSAYERTGDTFLITALPFWYVSDRFFWRDWVGSRPAKIYGSTHGTLVVRVSAIPQCGVKIFS